MHPGSRLGRVTARDGHELDFPEEGFFLDWYAASVLGAKTGDDIEVETILGLGPPRRSPLRIVGISRKAFGSASSTSLSVANRLLNEEGTASGMALTTDGSADERLERELGEMTNVFSVTDREKEVECLVKNLRYLYYSVGIMVIFSMILGFAIVCNASGISTDLFTFEAVIYPSTYLFAALGGGLFILISRRLAARSVRRLRPVEALKENDRGDAADEKEASEILCRRRHGTGDRLLLPSFFRPRGEISSGVEEDGYVQPIDDRNLYATQTARIVGLPVESGDEVVRGQTLVQMTNPDLDALLSETRSYWGQAEKSHAAHDSAVGSLRLGLSEGAAGSGRHDGQPAGGAGGKGRHGDPLRHPQRRPGRRRDRAEGARRRADPRGRRDRGADQEDLPPRRDTETRPRPRHPPRHEASQARLRGAGLRRDVAPREGADPSRGVDPHGRRRTAREPPSGSKGGKSWPFRSGPA